MTLRSYYLGALFERCRRPRNRAVWLVQPRKRDKSRMCGRYLITSLAGSVPAAVRLSRTAELPAALQRGADAADPDRALVEGRRQFALVRWGLIPPWVKDPRDVHAC